jgi:hypothetical protein
MEFVPLQWGKDCIDSQVALYAFNSMMPLQHIFAHINSELQLKAIMKQ